MKDKALRRVTERPDPAQWAPDELMTLREAAGLFWPSGPIKESTLRTAVHGGQLAVATIAGKLFTSPAEITNLAVLSRRQPAGQKTPTVRTPSRVGMSAREAKALVGLD